MSSAAHVTAVVVTHDAASFLPATVEGLMTQTRPVDALYGVDTGSRDGSAQLLRELLPESAVVLEEPGTHFGAAVQRAVDHMPSQGESAAREWLWFIHDDSEPAADALELMLAEISKSESTAVAGAKQVDASDRVHLLDAGLSLTRHGERFAGVGLEEKDQGQYDMYTDRLGVNSAGMLFRRDVFEELGGFDPALPGVGDDVDLGRRAWLAGHRVVLVPGAYMFHRPDVVKDIAGEDAQYAAAKYTRLKYAAPLTSFFLGLWMIVSGLGSAVARLIAGDTHTAGLEFRHAFAPLTRMGAVRRGRKSVRRIRKVPRSSVNRLLVGRAQYRDHERAIRDGLMLHDAEAQADQTTRAEASGDDDSFEAAAADGRTTRGVAAGVIAVALAAIVGAVTFRGAIMAKGIAGGALLTPNDSLSQMWHAAVSPWSTEMFGMASGPDAFAGILFWLALISGGNAPMGIVVAYFLALPAAAFTMWWALRLVTRAPAFRGIGALLWALAPVFAVDLTQGRIAPALVHVVLPLLVYALARAVGVRGAVGVASYSENEGLSSWPSAVFASVLAVVVVAAEPLWLVPLVVFTLVAAVVSRRARVLAWVPAPALIASAPTILDAIRTPRIALAQPGLPLPGEPTPAWQALLGFPSGFDAGSTVTGWGWLPGGHGALIVALACGVPLLLMGLIGLVAPLKRATWIRVFALVALVVFAASVAASWLVASTVGGQRTHYYVGSAVSLVWLAFVFSAGAMREAGTVRIRAHVQRTRWTGRLVAYSVMVTMLVSGTTWLAPMTQSDAVSQDADRGLGMQPAVHAVEETTLPVTAADRGVGPFEERTLVLSGAQDGLFRANIVTGDGLHLEEVRLRPHASTLGGSVLDPSGTVIAEAPKAQNLAKEAVAGLVSGDGGDAAETLRQLGVGYIVMKAAPNNGSVAKNLDSIPGIAAVTRGERSPAWLWQVDTSEATQELYELTGSVTSRVRVEAADGTMLQLLKSEHGAVTDQKIETTQAGSEGSGRLVVMAENFDSGWSASLNGKDLQPQKYKGWMQAFELPVEDGTLNITYSTWWQTPWLILSAIVAAFCALSMMPMPRGWRNRVRYVPVYREPYDPDAVATNAPDAEATDTPEHAAEPELADESEPATEPDPADESGPAGVSETDLVEEGERERKED
ncbi:glycosyltransferase family 2 protein [Pseudoglutamicibacter albus]|nr:glycosyltransferase family 2 protein [Pseudoglutamicibacter albus]